MSVFSIAGGNPALPTYPLQRSVRLRSSASAYFNRTPASATNRQKYTLSLWLKRGTLGTNQAVFSASDGTQNNEFLIYFDTNNALGFQQTVGGSAAGQISCFTNAVFRDPSAWYHIVVAIDTTQATSTNRLLLYINGVVQTFSSYSVGSSINTWVDNTNPHAIGKRSDASLYFDGYLTEINFVDGQQLTPSSFGAYNSYGVWSPAKYTGTYGTNGFYLNFQDNSALTTTANVGIGKDSSGNGNYWTSNNISITAGVTYDSMLDVPTNSSATNANFCTLNPLDKDSSATVTNGNLTVSRAAGAYSAVRSSIMLPTSGKFYAEATVGTTTASGTSLSFGFSTDTALLNNAALAGQYILYGAGSGSSAIYSNGTSLGSVSGVFSAGDILQIAFDGATGKAWVGKNNVWYNSTAGTTGDPANGSNNTFSLSGLNIFLVVVCLNDTAYFNAGQRPFSYTPPTGFVSLNTYNLPDSIVPVGAQYMAATLYTGNGSTQSIVNTVNGKSFQPDLVWYKRRNSADNNRLFDAVRGATKALFSDLTLAESTESGVTSFNTSGFTLGLAGNESSNTYVGWQWRASNASAVSNTSGTITSSISANQTAGFSIVTWTGTAASAATVGHGLGVAPKMIIIKQRNGSTYGWVTYHASVGAGSYLTLNGTSAATADTAMFNNTAPTSNVFTLSSGGDIVITNPSAGTMVAYCFAAVPGYSAFGSYTGNGSADGPFVYTNFKPRWFMVKASGLNESWYIYDSSRNTYNVVDLELNPNNAGAEATFTTLDFLSNGVKIRTTNSAFNTSSATYIYMAFAENPFKNALAR